MLPRRLATPRRGAGAPGIAVNGSSMTTSRASRTSTAKGWPPRVTTQARLRGAATAASAGGSGASAEGVGATASSGKALHHREELVGRERLAEVLVRPLPLAPGPVAFLVLAADEHHGRRLRAGVLAQRPEDLVPVALGHDDVEQQHVGALGGELV